MTEINEKLDAINAFDALENIDLNSREANGMQFFLMHFNSKDDYKEMLAFSEDASRLKVKTVNCGVEGKQLLTQFNKIWVVMDEETEVFLSMKYKHLMSRIVNYSKMTSLLETISPGYEGIFLSMCVIGFL